MEISFAHWLVLLSVCISLGGSFAYVRDTLAGKSKPNRVSWFLWAFVPLLGAGAALSLQADVWATVRTITSGLIPLIIFLASFINPRAYWKLSTFDIVCGVVAIFALALWALVDVPRISILLLAVADGFAALPTIIKAWQFPETETGLTYLAGLVAVVLILPSIPVWNIENSAFQIYLLIANSALAFATYRKKFGFV
jgi:hypothetical protein